MSPVLQAINLHKSIGRLAILNSVSISVEKGQRHAIIGPNGAGKSTLFNIIMGQTPADAGSVVFLSQEISRLPVERRVRLGLSKTIQSPRLFPSLSVWECLLAAAQSGLGWLKHSQRAQERAAQAATQIGLSDRLGVMTKNLSHGDRRLLEIGMGLAASPLLLLLDEPMAGLSDAERQRVTRLLSSLKETSLLFIEHDMESVFGLADKITVLHQGRVFAEGEPEQIRADPRVHEIYLSGRSCNDYAAN